MTKFELSQLRSLKREIEELEDCAREYGILCNEITPPSFVTGSDLEYPYIQHTIQIPGETVLREDDEGKEARRKLEATKALIRKKKKQRLELYDRILRWIMDIEDSETRRIFMMRYLKNWSWQRIAIKLEVSDEGTPRKKHDKFLSIPKIPK